MPRTNFTMEWKSTILLLFLTVSVTISEMDSPKVEPADESGTYMLSKGQNMTLYCRGNGLTWTRQTPLSQQDKLGHEDGFEFTIRPEKRTDEEYLALDLINVNEHTVGYYACHSANVSVDLNHLLDEPESTEIVTYVYIYVNGTDFSIADMRTVLHVPENTTFVVPCRPTVPNTTIQILDVSYEPVPSENYKYNPKIGFILDDPELSDVYHCISRQNSVTVTITPYDAYSYEIPEVQIAESPYTRRRLVGESVNISCTIVTASPVQLEWRFPNSNAKPIYSSNDNESRWQRHGDHLYRNIKLTNLSADDAGTYTCIAKYAPITKQTDISITILKDAILNPSNHNKLEQYKLNGSKKTPGWYVEVDSHPEPNYTIFHGEKQIYPSHDYDNKYEVKADPKSIHFKIKPPAQIQDSGNYTITISNGYLTKNVSLRAVIEALPVASLSVRGRYMKEKKYSFACDVSGNPLPDTVWRFEEYCKHAVNCPYRDYRQTSQKLNAANPYAYTSILELQLLTSGKLTCNATNIRRSTDRAQQMVSSSTEEVLLYEVEEGFAIEGMTWYSSKETVWMDCVASKYDYRDDITWYKVVGGERKKISSGAKVLGFETVLSYVRKLKIITSQPADSGTYECEARRLSDRVETRQHRITVEAWRPPIIVHPLENGMRVVKENLDFELNCTAEAVPPPTIKWFHDDIQITEEITEIVFNNTMKISTLVLRDLTHPQLGRYKCVATADDGQDDISSFVDLRFKNMDNKAIYLWIIGIIIVLFTILSGYLWWKFRKERRYRRKLYQQFNNGIGSLNPNLPLDEQADRLPYIKSFEFPVEDLNISDEVLGRGAFGEVYKAEARGIIDAEKVTTVAVKKVKPNADRMYIDALVSELKIMIHMGRHLNVLNLLGACTKKIAKRELLVILEYCKYGNIHKYMQTHRRSFVDELNDSKNRLENGRYNRGFSHSGDHSSEGYYGSSHTPLTANTTVNTAETCGVRTDGSDIPLLEIKGSESDNRDVNWRSNYNYYDKEGPDLHRRLTSTDLISWAYQIAAGMEYLASRKILHGDLAARNILLADDNVVKICDFGLARNIQKNEEYRKDSNNPVPVKWLALECLERQIFSTQSDVWSFGVFMWELFSLACTPYPGVKPAELVKMLTEGQRLEKPKYANDQLYNMMSVCWLEKPNQRPTFSALHQQLGALLDMAERERYDELNAPYVEANEQWRGAQDLDYLDQLPAPDFQSQVTPSPPPGYENAQTLETDSEGYLIQTTPRSGSVAYSHRNNGNGAFPFPRTAPRQSLAAEVAASAERAPMLPDPGVTYVQIPRDTIPEEDEAATAVDNPSYTTLVASEQRPPQHSYQNIIRNNRMMNRV